MIVNELKYPWLAAAAIAGGCQQHQPYPLAADHLPALESVPKTLPENSFASPWEGWSQDGLDTIAKARAELKKHGAVAFPDFLTRDAVQKAVEEMRTREDAAFTTNTQHTAYLTQPDTHNYPSHSIYNHHTPTIVASTAYDELPEDSVLKELYTDPRLLEMVSSIVLDIDDNNDGQSETESERRKLYLSEDPLGCCSVNVFRPGYYHGFHYDESEFSVTLMLQDAEDPQSGLFQYTDPIRSQAQGDDDEYLTLELKQTADVFRDHEHDSHGSDGSAAGAVSSEERFAEHDGKDNNRNKDHHSPVLHTLDFRPGTLLVLAGSRSLHRVTTVKGNRSRFVAVLTFASKPGFSNTPEVQEMFWGRTASDSKSASKRKILSH
jgi:hypothetical protein